MHKHFRPESILAAALQSSTREFLLLESNFWVNIMLDDREPSSVIYHRNTSACSPKRHSLVHFHNYYAVQSPARRERWTKLIHLQVDPAKLNSHVTHAPRLNSHACSRPRIFHMRLRCRSQVNKW
jgi:hypothetical protein